MNTMNKPADFHRDASGLPIVWLLVIEQEDGTTARAFFDGDRAQDELKAARNAAMAEYDGHPCEIFNDEADSFIAMLNGTALTLEVRHATAEV